MPTQHRELRSHAPSPRTTGRGRRKTDAQLDGTTVAVGLTSFRDDVRGSIARLLGEIPSGYQADAVALMPCFMRGKNTYGKNDVEPGAISELLPGVPLFGTFCHGELGPDGCIGSGAERDTERRHRLYGMASVVALHASRRSAAHD